MSVDRTVVLRTVMSAALAVIGWLLCGFFIVNLLLTGTPGVVLQFLPWLLLVAWGLYVLLWRPRLVIRADRLDVANLFRDHVIPFEDLLAVRVLQSVSFDTTAGRIPSWGAPGAGKLGPRMGSSAASGRVMLVPATQERIERSLQAWETARTDDGGQGAASAGPARGVSSRWNVPIAVVSVLLLLWTAATALFG